MDDLTGSEFAAILLVFRVLVGLIFASHGWAKRFSGGGIDGTAGWFESIGMRPGRLHAHAASTTEMGAGLLLALGLVTPVAAAGIIGVMVVAGWVVHRPNGFFIVSEGWEFTFVVGLMAVLVAGLGPGRYSLDHAIGWADSLNGWTGLAVALVLGIGAGAAQIAIFHRPDAPTPD